MIAVDLRIEIPLVRCAGPRVVVRKNSIGVAKQPIGTHDASRSGQVLR